MRVLTYNIHGWRDAYGQIDLARLTRVIRGCQADIVALNEVFHPLTPPSETRAALDLLAAAAGMAYAFGVALTPQFAFAPLASYGNALLTRFPLMAHAGHHLTPVAGYEQRGLLEARVALHDGKTPFSLYVTHLDHRSEAVRLQQLAAVFQWAVRDRDRPHLLMGDFNAVAPGDYSQQPGELESLKADSTHRHMVEDGAQVVTRILRRGYVDAQGDSPGATFPASDPLVRIDYIWLSASLAPALRWCQPLATEDTAVASDHLPVLAEIDETLLMKG